LGERGDRSRHRDLRRAVDSALVAADGRPAYRHAQSLLITADAAGSNGVWSVNGPFDLRDDPPDALKYGRGCPSDLWRIVERRWRPQFIRNLRSNHGYRSPDEEPSSRRSSTRSPPLPAPPRSPCTESRRAAHASAAQESPRRTRDNIRRRPHPAETTLD